MTVKLYLSLARQSFKEFIVYRTTSVLVVLFGFLFTIIELLAGKIYYGLTESIGGLSYLQYQLLIISLSAITYTYQFLFIGAHESLSEDIIEGNLDYPLLYPTNSYFYYTLRKLDFPSLINLMVYLPLTIYLLIRFEPQSSYLLILLFYVVSVLFVFAINQIVVEVAFWKDNMTALNGVPEYLIDAANRPAAIYPKPIRMILTNLIPVLPLSNGIIYLNQNNMTLAHLASLFAPLIIITIILLYFSYYLWKRGVKRYFSAN